MLLTQTQVSAHQRNSFGSCRSVGSQMWSPALHWLKRVDQGHHSLLSLIDFRLIDCSFLTPHTWWCGEYTSLPAKNNWPWTLFGDLESADRASHYSNRLWHLFPIATPSLSDFSFLPVHDLASFSSLCLHPNPCCLFLTSMFNSCTLSWGTFSIYPAISVIYLGWTRRPNRPEFFLQTSQRPQGFN